MANKNSLNIQTSLNRGAKTNLPQAKCVQCGDRTRADRIGIISSTDEGDFNQDFNTDFLINL